jgi:hypothetical protein
VNVGLVLLLALSAAPDQAASEEAGAADDEILVPADDGEEAEDEAETDAEAEAESEPVAEPLDFGSPPPPPPMEGETVAPPPPAPPPAARDPRYLEPRRHEPERALPRTKRREVNRILAAGAAAGGTLALGAAAAGCCSLCPCLALPLPVVCPTLGAGGGALAGSLIAGAPWTDAVMPAVASAGVGLAGGMGGLVGGIVLSWVTAVQLGVDRGAVANGLLGGQQDPAGLTSLAVLVAPVVACSALGAVGAGVVTYFLLPEEVLEVPAEAPQSARLRAPARPRSARSMAF